MSQNLNDRSDRGQSPFILHMDEFPFYLHDRPRPWRHVCIDESGPWPPVPVDPIVAKRRDIRIHKAEAKRARKRLKRLGLVQFPMTGPGYEQAKKFMIAIGQYELFLNNGQSVDGYTLVAWANSELK